MPSDFLNYISEKINNNPDKTAFYCQALIILLRRKFCSKEFLEILLQMQTTQSQAPKTLKNLEQTHVLLYNDINYQENIDFGDGINLGGLINDALDDLEDYFGVCFELTRSIREPLDSYDDTIQLLWPTKKLNSVIKNSSELLKEQKSIVFYALEETIKLFKYFNNLFAANAAHAIAGYAAQNVSIICPADIASTVLFAACAVDKLKLRVDLEVRRQAYNKISDANTEAMFKYVFDVANHAEECYHEFVDLLRAQDERAVMQPMVYYPIAAQYIYPDEGVQSVTPTTPSSPSAISSDSGVVVQGNTIAVELNEDQLCEMPHDNKSYADAVKTRTSCEENLKATSQVKLFDNSCKPTRAKGKAKNATAGSRKKKHKTRPKLLPIQPVDKAAECSAKQTIEKNHKPQEQKRRKPSFADFAAFVQDETEESEERPASPTNKEREKAEQKKNKENPTGHQRAQERTDDDFLNEAINQVTEERAKLAADKQLRKDCAEFVAKYCKETEKERRVSVMQEDIAHCLSKAAELLAKLALLDEKNEIKSYQKEIMNIENIIKALIIPKNIIKSINEITMHEIDTSMTTFSNLGKLIADLSKVGLLEHYVERCGLSLMEEFLNTLTELTKKYFPAGVEAPDISSVTKLMQSISTRILYLAIVSGLKQALNNEMLFCPNEPRSLEIIKFIEKCLGEPRINEESKISWLRDFIKPSSHQKILYIAIKSKAFKLARLLAKAFTPTEQDLYIAHINKAWDVVYDLLCGGADPFVLYKNGHMPFENIIGSGINRNIVFCIQLMGECYDDLNNNNKVVTIMDLLSSLRNKKNKINFKLRNAIKELLEKNPELSEIIDKMTIEEKDHGFATLLSEMAAEKKLCAHLGNNNLLASDSLELGGSLISKLFTLAREAIFEIGVDHQTIILKSMMLHAQYAIKEKIVVRADFKKKIMEIINNICDHVSANSMAILIKGNGLLCPNMYIPLIHILAEHVSSVDSKSYNLLYLIVTWLRVYKEGGQTSDLLDCVDTHTGETPLRTALRCANPDAVKILDQKLAVTLFKNPANAKEIVRKKSDTAHRFYQRSNRQQPGPSDLTDVQQENSRLETSL